MNSAFVQVLTAVAMVLSIVVPMAYYFKGEHSKKRYKNLWQPMYADSSEFC